MLLLGDGVTMKGVLYYFSGTGNTKWVADRFKESFKLYDINIDLVNIESAEEISIKPYNFFIIGSPVHAEAAPKIVDDFLGRLPKEESRLRAIVYSTQGAKSAAAASIVSKKLEQKGYNVIIQSNIAMPNNYYFGVGRLPTENMQKKMLEEAVEKVEILTKNFIENKHIKECNSLFRRVIGKVSEKAYRSMLPKLSKNITSTKECSKCGLCLRNCPKGNITFENGHAIFHSNCILCLRCIHICPINAITYKGKKINQIQKERAKSLNLNK